jgi:signal peptidase II
MILAGAVGNLIDCMFYGIYFHEAPVMQGRVVDMFYFPLIVTTYPEWFPLWGGEPFIFFSPIFNFADACISVAVVMLILFCRPEIEKLRN